MFSHSPYRWYACPLASIAFALLVCAPAQAQMIRGAVVDDSTRRPLEGAVLTLLDNRGREMGRPPVRTDSLGRFAVHTSGPGQVALRVNRIGYAPLTSQNISLVAGEAVTLTFSLSAVVQRLGAVVVLDKRRLNVNELMSDLGFELRRSKQDGKFLDSLDLTAYRGHMLDEVLLDHAGLNIVAQKGPLGDKVMMQNGLDSRGRPYLCEPEIWIDGFRPIANAQARLKGLLSNQIFGIEVFSHQRLPPAGIGGELGADQSAAPRDRRCGVLVVWTKAFISDLKKREGR